MSSQQVSQSRQVASEIKIPAFLVWQSSPTDHFGIIEALEAIGLKADEHFRMSEYLENLEDHIDPNEEQMFVISPPRGKISLADETAKKLRERFPLLTVASMKFANPDKVEPPYHLNINLSRGENRFDKLITEVKHFRELTSKLKRIGEAQVV